MVVGDRQVDDDRALLAAQEAPAAARLVGRAPGLATRTSRTPPPASAPTTARPRSQMAVVSKFTYTLETIIQAGKMLVAIEHVPIRTNPKTRESRLFPSMWRLRPPQRRLDLPHLRAVRAAARLHDARRRAVRRSALIVVGPLLRRLGPGRRRRPRPVADPRRRAVQRRGRAGRARRPRRPAVRPADHDPARSSSACGGSSCSSASRRRTTSPARRPPAARGDDRRARRSRPEEQRQSTQEQEAVQL